MHSFDDSHDAPYWPTWPCFFKSFSARLVMRNGRSVMEGPTERKSDLYRRVQSHTRPLVKNPSAARQWLQKSPESKQLQVRVLIRWIFKWWSSASKDMLQSKKCFSLPTCFSLSGQVKASNSCCVSLSFRFPTFFKTIRLFRNSSRLVKKTEKNKLDEILFLYLSASLAGSVSVSVSL